MDPRERAFNLLLLKIAGTSIGPGWAAVLGWPFFWFVLAVEAVALVPLAVRSWRLNIEARYKALRLFGAVATAVAMIVGINLLINFHVLVVLSFLSKGD